MRSKEVEEAINELKNVFIFKDTLERFTSLKFSTIETVLAYIEKIEKDNQRLRDDYLLLQKASEEYEDKLQKELETYKKIDDKLCETIDLLAEEKEAGYFCRAFIKSQQICDNHETCAACIIDWARKEVENGNNSSCSN